MAGARPPRMRIALGLVVLLLVAGCAAPIGGTGSSTPSASDEGVSVSGSVVAGPICPVVTEPPQSGCADRPVVGAVILVLDTAGDKLARVVSDEAGDIHVSLAPGRYRMVPQRVEGLMGTAPEQELTVADGEPVDDLVITYDTGIR